MNKSLYIIITLIIFTILAAWYSSRRVQTNSPLDTIIVGTNAEFPPFSFKQDDTITGFDIDVITQVLHRLGKKMIIQDMAFDALLPKLQLGSIQVIAAGMTPSPERAKRVLFTRPHLVGDQLAIISLKTNAHITNIHDLYGKNVVVNEGYTADTYISHYPDIHVIRIASASSVDGMLALQSGRAFAYISALRPLQPYFDAMGTQEFQIVPIADTEESSAFAVSKFHPELLDFIQVTLDRMEEDGTLQKLKEKWRV